MSAGDSRIFGLDLVRAVAILLVLASHLVDGLEPLGILGVELFFVLSGFLVGGIFLKVRLNEDPFSLSALVRFWRRRWWRTLPNYFLFLAVFTLIAWSAGKFPGWGKILMYPVFLQNWLWPSDSFFLLSWSLAVEEWFYLLMPLFVILTGLVVRNLPASFAMGCLMMGVISCAARVLFFTDPPWDSVARKVCLGRMDALAWGCVMAYGQQQMAAWYRGLCLVKSQAIVGAAVLGCIGAVYYAYPDGRGPVPPEWLLAIVPLCFSLLLPTAANWTKLDGPVAKLITNTSKWSYSLYLVHIPIILLTLSAPFSGGGMWQKLAFKLLALVASFGCSALLYRYYELPMMRLRPDQSSRTVTRKG
jgi:peptidoglycan/LPS O-acetylase OafA/YrhL